MISPVKLILPVVLVGYLAAVVLTKEKGAVAATPDPERELAKAFGAAAADFALAPSTEPASDPFAEAEAKMAEALAPSKPAENPFLNLSTPPPASSVKSPAPPRAGFDVSLSKSNAQVYQELLAALQRQDVDASYKGYLQLKTRNMTAEIRQMKDSGWLTWLVQNGKRL